MKSLYHAVKMALENGLEIFPVCIYVPPYRITRPPVVMPL